MIPKEIGKTIYFCTAIGGMSLLLEINRKINVSERDLKIEKTKNDFLELQNARLKTKLKI